MDRFLVGCAAGAFAVSSYYCRRGFAREWRWMLRDLADLRVELRRWCR
jgi:hypothetical protein